jgi:hypothetical protein
MNNETLRQFRPMVTPSYREAHVGLWHLTKKPYSKASIQHGYTGGYWSLTSRLPSRYAWTLMHGEEKMYQEKSKVWMSLTPMELESQGFHARMARGRVAVMGLGMGAVVYNLAQHGKVEHITVVERDPDIVRLLSAATDWFDMLQNEGRLRVVLMDALQFAPIAGPFDTLLVDIWQALGHFDAEPDTLKIQANVRAKQVGWWGQELDLVSFLNERGLHPPITDAHLRLYQERLGFNLLGAQHPAYKHMALEAAKTFATLGMHRQRKELCLSLKS